MLCRLLPALLRFAEADAPPGCQAHALRFVEFCIHHLENDDPAIHHLAVCTVSPVTQPRLFCTYLNAMADCECSGTSRPLSALLDCIGPKFVRACGFLPDNYPGGLPIPLSMHDSYVSQCSEVTASVHNLQFDFCACSHALLSLHPPPALLVHCQYNDQISKQVLGSIKGA